MEDLCLWILQNWDEKGDISCYPGPMAPMLVWLAWYEFMMILWRIRSSVPRMAKIGGSILCPTCGLVFSFLQNMALFPLASWRQPLWLPPSMKVVPQFCPVARNFLLRALECSVEHRVGAFQFVWPHTQVGAVSFHYKLDRKGLVFVKAKAVDRRSQSGTRLKDPIWNLSIKTLQI